MVSEADFSYQEEPVPTIKPGQILIRNLYVSFDPAMRGWMTENPDYVPPIPVGEVMRASAIGQVVESNHPNFVRGDFVSGWFGWQDYAVGGGGGSLQVQKFEPVHPLPRYLGVLGGTGLTAYFGLLEVGKPKEGETVVVSGAAGATGSVAAQIANIKGCRVIGIAGGTTKCRWLTEELKLDAAIGHMAVWGRIALCGMISGYNAARPDPGPGNLFLLITRRVKMDGFLILDYAHRFGGARRELSAWLATGKLRAREDVQEGFENIPKTFLRLFRGDNVGKQVLKLTDPPIAGTPSTAT